MRAQRHYGCTVKFLHCSIDSAYSVGKSTKALSVSSYRLSGHYRLSGLCVGGRATTLEPFSGANDGAEPNVEILFFKNFSNRPNFINFVNFLILQIFKFSDCFAVCKLARKHGCCFTLQLVDISTLPFRLLLLRPSAFRKQLRIVSFKLRH